MSSPETNERIECTNPKFKRWLNKDAWSLDEVGCLFIGVDPNAPGVRKTKRFQKDYKNALEDIQRAAVVAKVIPYIDPPDAKPGILHGLHRYFPLIPVLVEWASKRSERFPFRVVHAYSTPFAKNMTQLQTECAWTDDVMAHKIGIDRGTVINHRKGATPSPKILQAYADAFSKQLGRKIKPSDLTQLKPN